MQEMEIRRIVSLLSSTDTAIPDIAVRMGCSRSAVIAINRKFRVREYAGRRSTWSVNGREKDGVESR